MARTISRGNGAPTPAAWLISRRRWSSAERAGSTNVVAEFAEPGRHAVDDGALVDQRRDDGTGLRHPLAGVASRAADAPWRATASTSAIVRSAPVRTTVDGRRRAARRGGPGRSGGPPAHSPLRG